MGLTGLRLDYQDMCAQIVTSRVSSTPLPCCLRLDSQTRVPYLARSLLVLCDVVAHESMVLSIILQLNRHRKTGITRYLRRRGKLPTKRHVQKVLVHPLAFVLLFTLFGLGMACILVELEAPTEQANIDADIKEHGKLTHARNQDLDALMAFIASTNTSTKSAEQIEDAMTNLTRLSTELDNLLAEYVHVDLADPTATNWTFIGALYFVFTIITTIGYGTFAPVTAAGQAATVIIGLVGIPLFSVVVKSILSAFHIYFARLMKLMERPQLTEKFQACMRIILLLVLIMCYWLASARIFEACALSVDNHWSFGQAMYYTAITFLTIGLGDYSVSWYGPYAHWEITMFVAVCTIGLTLFIELNEMLYEVR